MTLKTRVTSILIGLVVVLVSGSALAIVVSTYGGFAASAQTATTPTTTPNCDPNKHMFFGLEPWYKYIGLHEETQNSHFAGCTVDLQLSNGHGVKDLNKLWLIVMAIFEDLLRIATVVAFAFVVYGGFRYITSQGEPENIKAALRTIVSALIGLVIAIVSATVIGFIATALGTK